MEGLAKVDPVVIEDGKVDKDDEYGFSIRGLEWPFGNLKMSLIIF